MFEEQWALSNDGTFSLETEQNGYEAYNHISAPGQWNGSDMSRMGITAATAGTTAASGVDINAEEAWALNSGEAGKKVVVALIDTGVDYTHEDLADSIWTNADEIAGNGIDDDGNGYIDDVRGWNFYNDSNEVYVGSEDNHGTHGAGTIAANSDNSIGIAGIAGSTGNVEIMVLKALGGTDGSGTTEDVIRAIAYAEDNGASIVNLSLGVNTFDYALYFAMANSDLLFVVAAGNDGADSDNHGTYPAAYNLANIISVANLQCDGTLNSSSNFGETSVDLAAPGTYILSTTTGSGYGYMTGTSMAAPMVSATAALVYSYYDDLCLSDVKQIILGSAKELDSLDGLVETGGMLDTGAALSYDLDTLTDPGEDTETDAGTAPVISCETYTENGQCYLTVIVTDEEGDFCTLCYAQGEQTADYFNYGSGGTQVEVGRGNSATFRITGSGTCTFYALDTAGNETVKVVTVTTGTSSDSTSDESNGGGYRIPPGNFPGGNQPGGIPPMNSPHR
ncbi:hypothetical protein SDC9_93917 [bioreactor metagenome]|uniref:Peptidase S8/S53 domain-containing protein n=1 Tax=bioreactor metagenome TaxID=1076179 RepID=A0A645A1X8_9ZZZZ